MTSISANLGSDVSSQVLGRLMIAMSLVLALGSSPAFAASSVDSSLTEPEFPTMATYDRAALAAARGELDRARALVVELQDDMAMASVEYLRQLLVLLGSVQGQPTASELHALTTGLRQARLGLDRSKPSDLLGILANHRARPELRDPRLLERALRSDPDLPQLTIQAMDAALSLLGDGATTLALEPHVDPEHPDEVLRVFLVLVTRLDVEAGNQMLETLQDEWFLDNCHLADGRLSLAIDYV